MFDVFVEELLVASAFDAVKLAGPKTAVILDRVFSVSDGNLTIRLAKGVENPFICGLEVIASTAPAPVPAASPVSPPVNASVPVALPITPPVTPPVPVASPIPQAPSKFSDILINCGGTFCCLNELIRC